MKGSYRGYSTAVSIVGIVLSLLLSLYFAMDTTYSVIMPCCFVPLLFALWLSDNLPCRFSADGGGFEINEMFFITRYEYAEVWDIKYVQEHKKTGDYIKLTVSGSFGDKVYYEKCGKESPQLVRLCEYVDRVKEEGV